MRALRKKKILIADDDPAILDSVQMLLRFSGYEVDPVLNQNILEEVIAKPPDIILLDIWMSGQDGRELCRDLKNNAQTKKIPVILISAGKNIKKSLQKAGADDFIAKPFEMKELLLKIKKYTSGKKK